MTRKRTTTEMKKIVDIAKKLVVLISAVAAIVSAVYSAYQFVYSKGADAVAQKIEPRFVAIESKVDLLIRMQERQKTIDYVGNTMVVEKSK